jgi:peptidoglycan hydrolase-like protein with peptidoglycan-binding domain
MKTKKITLLFCAAFLSMGLSAKDIYVSSSAGDDSKDGSSTANAVKTIEQAYTLAADGDVIKLDGKFVFESVLNIEKPNLTIVGASSNPTSTKATLDGDNSFYFFNLKSSVTLRNLIFTKGYGGDGGALNIPLGFERDIKIEDCLFTLNEAGNRGGAIWCQTYGLPDKLTINRCAFINNLAGGHGGVIGFIPEGGATNKAMLNIYNTTFASNSNLQGGGGVLFVDGSATNTATFNFTNITVSGNVGGDNGGNCPGFRFIGNEMVVNIKNSIIEGNTAVDGSFYDISFTDTPKALTIQNSIVGNVTVNGGTTPTTNFISVGSNVNNVSGTSAPVSGLGELSTDHFLLTTSSLAYKYGKVENLIADNKKDQLGKERGDLTYCSAGAVEYFMPVTGVKNGVIENAKVISERGKILIVAANVTAKVITLSGTTVSQIRIDQQAEINVKPGVYIVQLESETNRQVTKVIVK